MEVGVVLLIHKIKRGTIEMDWVKGIPLTGLRLHLVFIMDVPDWPIDQQKKSTPVFHKSNLENNTATWNRVVCFYPWRSKMYFTT